MAKPPTPAWITLGSAVAVGLAVPFGIAVVSSPSAEAATLQDGWFYAIDTFDDGVTGGVVGGGAFEIYGMALKAEADALTIALNANLPLSGYANDAATDGMIHWGDLFFNFSGQDFASAAATGELWGIRFSEENDSGVSELGVYKGVVPASVTAANAGFASLSSYNATVINQGGTPSLGDLPGDTDYLDRKGAPLNSIAAGQKVGNLSWDPDLAGLDFVGFEAVGSETIAFSIERSLFPEGSFIAHVLAECANDGVAIAASLPTLTPRPDVSGTSVPEPSGNLGWVGLLLWVGSRWKSKRFQSSNSKIQNG